MTDHGIDDGSGGYVVAGADGSLTPHRPARSTEPPRASGALTSVRPCRECRGARTVVVQVSGSRVPNVETCDRCDGSGVEPPAPVEPPTLDPNVGTCLACGGPVERYTSLGPNPTSWWDHVTRIYGIGSHTAIVDDPTDARLVALRRAIRAEAAALRAVAVDLHDLPATRDARLAGIADALDAMAGPE